MKIVDNGHTLDATFALEEGRPETMLVFESRSGKRGTPSARNSDYERGLEVLLTRLQQAHVDIKAIRLHPANGKLGSSLDLGRFGPPVLLQGIDDVRALRLAMTHAQQETDRRRGARGGGNPTKRLRMYLSVDAATTDVRALERRLAGLESRGYWALFADPRVYRIDDAVAELATDNWTTRGKDIHAGDRVLIWRGRGGGRAERGVVAFGEVESEPVVIDDAANPHWVDRAQAATAAPRVRVRYNLPERLPLLEHGPHADVLAQLPVARARGGTVFRVEPDLWDRVVEAAGGWFGQPTLEDALDIVGEAVSHSDGRRPASRGQGFGLTQPERHAVDRHAMAVATQHFESLGYVVTDTSNGNCYDLACAKLGASDLRVEVKGTTGEGEAVRLTRNEVDHAREQYPHIALAIVSGITLVRGEPPVASGGTLRVLNPWRLEDGTLTPFAFDYELPAVSVKGPMPDRASG